MKLLSSCALLFALAPSCALAQGEGARAGEPSWGFEQRPRDGERLRSAAFAPDRLAERFGLPKTASSGFYGIGSYEF